MEYFIKNYSKLSLDEGLIKDIKTKFTSIKNSKFKKRIGIISNDGIDATKSLIIETLNDPSIVEQKDLISIKYDNTPNYMVETIFSQELLDEFIQLLQSKSKDSKNQIYIKI